MILLVILGAFVAASSAQGLSFCKFPFIYKNVRYTSCITQDDPDGKLWCSTNTDSQGYHVIGGDNYRTCPGPSFCQIPFIYKKVRYTECTKIDDPEGKLWCSTKIDAENNHIQGGNFKHCPDSGSTNTDINNGDDTFLNLISQTSNRNFFPQQQLSSSCSLPEGGTGTCGSLSQCGAYRSFLTSLNNQNTLQYLIARLCRVETRRALVCCPRFANQPSVSRPRPTPRPVNTPRPPAPTSSSLFPTVCGQSVADRVVGGTEISVGAYPWLVAIGSPGFGSFSASCGGSLITHKHVLTAAHCWDFTNPSHVRVGEHDLSSDRDGANPQDIRIASRSIHFSYNKDLSENDVAIATLERDVRFDSHIQPICLPFRNDLKNNNFEGNRLDVVGWGKTDERTRTTVPRPREGKVGVQTINKCQQAYKNVRNIRISGKQLCAGGDGIDSCQGDSGGPLNYLDNNESRYYLAGITSTGVGCARPNIPGVYVRVGAYLDWIESNVR